MEAPSEAQGQYFNIVYVCMLQAFAKVKLTTLRAENTSLVLNVVT
jgi:hypothetical protein